MNATTAPERPVLNWERVVGVALLAFLAVVRWRAISRFRIESDEPQHLHVVWGWTRGFLPYRDFFDNHTPLFHLLYAPVLSLLGERADILVVMRIADLPLFALTLWAVFLLGRTLYGARGGWWALLLTAAERSFFYTSIEFRADVLWALLAMATLAVLLGGGNRRWLWAGLLLGATLAASIKTALLVVSFCLATALWLGLNWLAGGRVEWRQAAGRFVSLVGASLVVPLALAVYFYRQGGWPGLVYCLFHHNTGSAGGLAKSHGEAFVFLGVLATGMAFCWFSRRWGGLKFGRALLVLGATVYLGLLLSFWSVLTPVTPQDWLPLVPMLAVTAGGMLAALPGQWRPALGLTVLGGLVVVLLRPLPDNVPQPGKYERFLASVLRLTGPEDYVMDAKGEAIFRKRPYYFCLETQTRRRLIKGSLPDDIPERLIATRTAVTRTNRLPDRAEAFVEKNYLPAGRGISVLGQFLVVSKEDPARYVFEVAVPERYVIVAENGPVAGELDGRPYVGAVELAAGRHEFVRTSGNEALALFWARAAERGFSAFAERKVDDAGL